MSGRFTVVGARGFIGTAVAVRAREEGYDVLECRHDDVPPGDLGIVAYCSGVAWDADRNPFDAYDRHVTAIARILAGNRYERAIYVSSTRVYDRAASTSEEVPAAVRSDVAGDTYALTKLAGEGVVLSAAADNRVVRASNVYGASFRSALFLSDILRQAAQTGRIAIRSDLASSKDYVSVDDVADCVVRIASSSKHRIYNVAAGRNTTHRAILDTIAAIEPIELDVAPGSPVVAVAPIDVGRIRQEFGFEARDVVADLPALVRAFRGAFARAT